MPPPDTSIIFLTYNKRDLINRRLREVRRIYPDLPDGVEICVLDNGSDAGDLTFFDLVQWKEDVWPQTLEVFKAPTNLGFGRGFNLAVQELSHGNNLILVSNDVKINGRFIELVLDGLEQLPTHLIGHRLINHPAGWNEFGGQVISYLEGYFLACKREMWEQVGGFNEDFNPYDYEDMDLSYRWSLTPHGGLYPLPQLPLLHMAGSTIGYSTERRVNTNRMRAMFAKIHGLPLEPREL